MTLSMDELLADLAPSTASESDTTTTTETTETPATETEQVEEGTTETETEEPAADADAADKEDGEGDEDETSDDEQDDDKPKKLSRSQRMKRQIETLRSQLAQAEQRATDPARKPVDPAPKFEAFNGDFDAYDAARIKWAAREAIREQQTVFQQTQEQRMREDLQAETIREFQASQATARKAIPDFEAVVSKAQIPVARHVGELILESDKAGLLQYHLATRPELVDELNGLSPADAARRIGRLEGRLSYPKPRTETKAPPPSAKLRGAATPSSPDADLDAWLTKKYGKK